MPTYNYYVDPVAGSDAWTEAQARNTPTKPWATLDYADDTCASATAICNINIVNGATCNVGATFRLEHQHVNLVTYRPVTDVANGTQAITFTGTGSSLIRTMANAGNYRFEHVTLAGAATRFPLYVLGVGQTISNLAFYDCAFSQAADANYPPINWNDVGGSVIQFVRCTFGFSAGVGGAALQFGLATTAIVIDNLLFEDCTLTAPSSVDGLSIACAGSGLTIRGGSFSAGDVAIHIGQRSVLGSRQTRVLLSGVAISTSGIDVALYLNADNIEVEQCSVDGGTSIEGAITAKFGTGYFFHDNILQASVAGSPMILKGLTNVVVFNNRLSARAGAACLGFVLRTNTDDSNKVNSNLAVLRNTFSIAGAASAISILAGSIDAKATLLFDQNAFVLSNTGTSAILGTTVAADSLANIKAAWVTQGYPNNEKHAFGTAVRNPYCRALRFFDIQSALFASKGYVPLDTLSELIL